GSSVNGSGVFRAFLWSGGALTDLGSLNGPGAQSGAYAINDSGIVVGSSTPVGGGPNHATSWQGGTITDLYPSAGVQSAGEACNGAGQVIGGVGVGSSAVVWNAGTSTILGSGNALGINTSGQIVGTSAFNT